MNILNNWQLPLILVLWGLLILLTIEAYQFILNSFKTRKQKTKEAVSSNLSFHYKVVLEDWIKEQQYILEEGEDGVLHIKPIFRYDQLNGVEVTQLDIKTNKISLKVYYFDSKTNNNLKIKSVEKVVGIQYILVEGAPETNIQPEKKNVHYFYLEDIQNGNMSETLDTTDPSEAKVISND